MGCFNLTAERNNDAQLNVSREDSAYLTASRNGSAEFSTKRIGFMSFSASLICSIVKDSVRTWLFDKNGIALYAVDGTPLGYQTNE